MKYQIMVWDENINMWREGIFFRTKKAIREYAQRHNITHYYIADR